MQVIGVMEEISINGSNVTYFIITYQLLPCYYIIIYIMYSKSVQEMFVYPIFQDVVHASSQLLIFFVALQSRFAQITYSYQPPIMGECIIYNASDDN